MVEIERDIFQPRLHIGLTGMQFPVWTVMHHRRRRDAIQDLFDLEKFLRARGYRCDNKAPDPLRRTNLKKIEQEARRRNARPPRTTKKQNPRVRHARRRR